MEERLQQSGGIAPEESDRMKSSSRSASHSSSSSTTFSALAAVLILVAVVFVPHCGGVHLDEHTNQISPSSHKSSYQYDRWWIGKPGRRRGHGHHSSRLSLHRQHKKHLHHLRSQPVKVYYQTGSSDGDLPVCSPFSVCNKVDTYGAPWVQRQCTCPGGGDAACSSSTHPRDGHTVTDKTKQYKICEPVKRLRRCRFFSDVTFTRVQYPDNSTQQVMQCRCPKNSVAYLVKRSAFHLPKKTEEEEEAEEEHEVGFQFSFACSPKTRIRCQRKEPCRLFSVRESEDDDDSSARPPSANQSDLCHCPRKKRCPAHHADPAGVVAGKTYGAADGVRTYSAYCV